MKNRGFRILPTRTALRRFVLVTLGCTLLLGPPTFDPLWAQSADEFFSRAVSRYVNHRHEKARKLLREALELNPRHDNARRLYRELGGRLERPDTSPRNAPGAHTPPRKASRPDSADRSGSDTGSGGSRTPYRSVAWPDTLTDRVDPGDTSPSSTDRVGPEESPTRREVYARDRVDTGASIPSLVSLKVIQYGDRVTLKLRASRPIDVIVSRLHDPPVLVLDIPGSRDRLPPSPLELDMDPVLRVRHSRFREDPFPVTRLALDLRTESIAHRLRQTRSSRRVVVDVFQARSDAVKKKSRVHTTPENRFALPTSP